MTDASDNAEKSPSGSSWYKGEIFSIFKQKGGYGFVKLDPSSNEKEHAFFHTDRLHYQIQISELRKGKPVLVTVERTKEGKLVVSDLKVVD